MLGFSKHTCGKEWPNEIKFAHRIRYHFRAYLKTGTVSEFELCPSKFIKRWPYTCLNTAPRIPFQNVQHQRVQLRSPRQVFLWLEINRCRFALTVQIGFLQETRVGKVVEHEVPAHRGHLRPRRDLRVPPVERQEGQAWEASWLIECYFFNFASMWSKISAAVDFPTLS